MKRIGSIILCLCVFLQTMPLYSFNAYTQGRFLKVEARLLSTSEMKNIIGGKSISMGGSSSSPVTKKINNIPWISQYVNYDYSTMNQVINGVNTGASSNTVEHRSKSYCGFACNSMIAGWENPYNSWIGSLKQEELHMIGLDRNAYYSNYAGNYIDVYAGGGFLYHGGSSNSANMSGSKASLQDLYQKEASKSLSMRTIDSPGTAFDRIWNDVQSGYPSLVVVKTGYHTLHYIIVIVTGTHKENGVRSFYTHNPGTNYVSVGKFDVVGETEMEDDMRIANTGGYNFGWVGTYQAGDALYGRIY